MTASVLICKQTEALCPLDPMSTAPHPCIPPGLVQGTAREAVPALQGDWQAFEGPCSGNGKPELGGQRGCWGWKNICDSFSAGGGAEKERKENSKSRQSSKCGAGRAQALSGLSCLCEQAFSCCQEGKVPSSDRQK